MQIKLLEEKTRYDGTQLRGHFAYENFGILGDSCLGFIGPCKVTQKEMVDLEDVRQKASILSKEMLHFILESFSLELRGAICLQRMIICLIAELFQESGVQGLKRQGDDLYLQEKKLSVSIATRSELSCLIHIGLNIRSEGTPVPTVGLYDVGINPPEFAKLTLEKISEEYQSILAASYKVRAVK